MTLEIAVGRAIRLPELGRRAAARSELRSAAGRRIACLTSLLITLILAIPARAATFYVTMSGLGGETDYEQRFKMWAEDVDGSLKKAGGDSTIATLVNPTKEQVKAQFGEVAGKAKPGDALVVMMIGHGTYDGTEYKFNLKGADLTAAELGALMDHVPAHRQLVVNTTSASGGSIEALRRPTRIVITSTKTGSEKNATIFARYWAEALRDPAADTDKNEAVSALEAFRFAQTKTTEFFDTQKRLATEHSVIEDTGKGTGERTATSENGQGKLAGAFALVRLGANAANARDPNKRPLIAKKEELEQAIDKLKFEKAAMQAADYKRQLTQLLIQLAQVQEALDK
jgi:hypothetical protein